MFYKNEPTKNRNGVKARFFCFVVALATVAFFGITQKAFASTTLTEFMTHDTSKEDFAETFATYAPITHQGLSMTDFIITPNSGAADYNVILYSDGGVYATGGASSFFFNSNTHGSSSPYAHGYVYAHYTAGGFGGVSSMVNGDFNNPYFSGEEFILDTPSYSSLSIKYLDNCSSYQTGNVISPAEYYLCGTSDSSCSPLLTASVACGGVLVNPPAVTTSISCTLTFAAVPDFTDDPFGFFTGIYSAIIDWLLCGFNGMLSSIWSMFEELGEMISGFFDGLSDDISGMFSSLVQSISDLLSYLFVPATGFLDNQIETIHSDFKTQFADFFNFYDVMSSTSSTDYVDRFSGTMVYSGHNINFELTPLDNVPSFVPVIFSLVAYLGLGFFLIRKLPTLFES